MKFDIFTGIKTPTICGIYFFYVSLNNGYINQLLIAGYHSLPGYYKIRNIEFYFDVSLRDANINFRDYFIIN